MSCQPDASLDPRVRRTRKLLQDAFSALLFEKEFADITVQDITARATVNRATFYAHYADKQEIAASVLCTRMRSAIYAHFQERPTLTPENIVVMAATVFTFLGAMQDRCPKTGEDIQAAAGVRLQEELYNIMEEWLAHSPNVAVLFPHTSRETVATVLSWSIYGGARRWSTAKRRRSAQEVCEELVALVVPGADLAVLHRKK